MIFVVLLFESMKDKEKGVYSLIYKFYRASSNHAIINFQKSVVCFSHASVFDDKNEADAVFSTKISLMGTPLEANEKEILASEIAAVRFRYRIFCACTNSDEEYLWKAYAEDEKGFCLEYDENDFQSASNQIIIRSVIYSEQIPELTGEQSPEEIVMNQLFHKRMDYMPEKEIRIIYPLPDRYIQVEKSNMQFEENMIENPDKGSNSVIYCSSIPIDHITRDNDKLPTFEKRTAPLNVEVPMQSKGIIIGRNCEKEIEERLREIAIKQGIRIRKRGKAEK